MMKKGLLLIAVLITVLLLASCSMKSPLKEVTGATNSQAKAIEDQLASVDIICKSISVSRSPIVDDLDTDWKAYDLVGEDDCMYLLILRKEDNDFTVVFDSDGNGLSGLIDNAVLPSYFANKYLDQLKQSVMYDGETGQLQFTIPERIPQNMKLNILVSGRVKAGESGMSWHAFEEENKGNNWEPGKIYATKIEPEELDFILISASIIGNEDSAFAEGWDITIGSDGTITEDAYETK